MFLPEPGDRRFPERLLEELTFGMFSVVLERPKGGTGGDRDSSIRCGEKEHAPCQHNPYISL